MRKQTLVLGACAALAITAVAAIAGNPRWKIVAADQAWLWSDECSLSNTVEIPGVGFATDQCALEADLKRRLREGPIDAGPATEPKLKI